MLVDDSNYATLDSIVKELALIKMDGTDPVQIHFYKASYTRSSSCVYS